MHVFSLIVAYFWKKKKSSAWWDFITLHTPDTLTEKYRVCVTAAGKCNEKQFEQKLALKINPCKSMAHLVKWHVIQECYTLCNLSVPLRNSSIKLLLLDSIFRFYFFFFFAIVKVELCCDDRNTLWGRKDMRSIDL